MHSILKTKVYTPGDFKGSLNFGRTDIVGPVFFGSDCLGMEDEILALHLISMIDVINQNTRKAYNQLC